MLLRVRRAQETAVSLRPYASGIREILRSTMSRIDPQHLAWILEGLVDGEVRNRIVVDADTAEWAKVALERMLAIT